MKESKRLQFNVTKKCKHITHCFIGLRDDDNKFSIEKAIKLYTEHVLKNPCLTCGKV